VFQIATNIGYTNYEEQVPLLSGIARAAGRPVTYTHPQSPDWREAVGLLDAANRDAEVDLKAQLLPRPVGMLVGLSVTANPFCMNPTYLDLKDLPLEQRVAEMAKPEVRAAILGEAGGEAANPLISLARRYDRLFVTGDTVNYEPPAEASIAELARQRGQAPEEAAYDELLKDGGKALMLMTMGNYEAGSLDWMEPMLDSENVVIGLGDGGAHYGMVCDASYSTFSLAYWARDRPHGRRPLEEIVRRLSRDTALLVGLEDRGLIAPGHRADLNVIDHDRLSLHTPEVVADLPGGGKRLDQRADGYVATLVHGRIIMRGGVPTAERPGRLIRGAQTARVAKDQAVGQAAV
jgi:N-acyl-D-aspartate/D-glutamate deacylase